MASLNGLPLAILYTTSKHAVVGLMRSLSGTLQVAGMRIATVAPWFIETNIFDNVTRVLLAGLPLATVERAAAAIFLAATDEPATHGAIYSLPDEREVFRIPQTCVDDEMYAALNQRLNRVTKLQFGLRAIPDLAAMAWKSVFVKTVVFAVASLVALTLQAAITKRLS